MSLGTNAAHSARVLGPSLPEDAEVLTPPALAFVAELVRAFSPRVDELLALRQRVQSKLDGGWRFGFLPETRQVRESAWTVAPLPADLLDRRVEITGPVERKMMINALNSGANIFMADFEDSNAPTWSNLIEGQKNLIDAVRGTIAFVAPETGKHYALNERIATLMVRPRGWHLREKHLVVDGRDVPGALFDFGLFFFHNAKALLAKGSGPYFYLPKLESHLEARLWNDVFLHAQRALDLGEGKIKATVLIETLPASFEMDEILWELREHSAGLNCGRWDYIFSFIKKLRSDPKAVLPDRAQVSMEQPFMRAYTQRVIQVCHRRNVHAMGGMAAQIPIKNDKEANALAIDRVRTDKLREVKDGHDGTWVAHPGLVPLAREVFDAHMKGKNQLDKKREDVNVSAADLLQIPQGTRTERGLRQNVNVGVQYLEAWLSGSGCVPLYNLMEDAATAEISRAQLWQWVKHGAALDDGRTVTKDLVRQVLAEELARIRSALPEGRFEKGRFEDATTLFERLVTSDPLDDFLTLAAYDLLVTRG